MARKDFWRSIPEILRVIRIVIDIGYKILNTAALIHRLLFS